MIAFARIAGSRWIDSRASEIATSALPGWGDHAQFCSPAGSLSQREFYAISNRLFPVVNRRRTRGGQDTLLTIMLVLLTSAKNSSEWTVRLVLASVSSREETCAYVVGSLAVETFLSFER